MRPAISDAFVERHEWSVIHLRRFISWDWGVGIAGEYGLHLESSDITSRMREVHCEIEASQHRISEFPKQAASDEGQAASAGERTRRPVAKSCKGQ